MTKRRTRSSGSDGKLRSPAALRGMMERVLGEIGKLDLGDMTPEEAQAYIEQQLASGSLEEATPKTPLDEAQELIYEAWEATGKRRQTLARRALEISPDCADAYLILAETATSPEQARELYQKGVEAGERAIGPEGFREYEGHFWGVIETRPYMRARAELAMSLWEQGEAAKAAEHYAEMLRLNPSDNQGIRYLYIHVLIELGRDKDAMALLNRYKDDAASGWAYNRALLAFRQGGANHRSNRALGRALDLNPFVPLYLLGLVPPPGELPPSIGFGDETEAIDYAYTGFRNWTGTPEVVGWLAGQWGTVVLDILREQREEHLDALADLLMEEAEEMEEDSEPDDEGPPQPGS